MGGKGGFGANLRAAGHSGPSQQTKDFGACRDLYGRRLSSVNNELRLRRWLSSGERERRAKLGEEYEEPRGASGISGWYLGVPSWAEGVGEKSSPFAEAARARKKTVICKQWLEARDGGRKRKCERERRDIGGGE